MTIDYKALAERIRQDIDISYYCSSSRTTVSKYDLRTVVSLLEGMADRDGMCNEPCFCDTAYPDANPDVTCGDCPRDYARQPVSEPTEAQIEARDALLDFISENGTASEGVQHYLDRYVRAALAAKETK